MATTLNDIRQQLATNGATVQFRMVDKFLGGSGSKVLPRLYLMESKAFSYEYVVRDGFGGTSFRSLNTNYDTGNSSSHREREPMSVFGGEVRTDFALIDIKGDAARMDELDARMISAGKLFDKVFFNGNPAAPISGPKGKGNEMRGLKVRAVGTQLLSGGANGGPLTLDLLDQALDTVVGDNAQKVIQMNRVMRRALSSLLRAQNRVQFTLNDKRQVMTYDDAQIDILDEDENYNPILDFNETWGNSNLTTSIYVTRFGQSQDDEFVQGLIGNKFMQLRPPANLGTHVLEVAETLMGLGTFHPRSFCRIAGLLPG